MRTLLKLEHHNNTSTTWALVCDWCGSVIQIGSYMGNHYAIDITYLGELEAQHRHTYNMGWSTNLD